MGKAAIEIAGLQKVVGINLEHVVVRRLPMRLERFYPE